MYTSRRKIVVGVLLCKRSLRIEWTRYPVYYYFLLKWRFVRKRFDIYNAARAEGRSRVGNERALCENMKSLFQWRLLYATYSFVYIARGAALYDEGSLSFYVIYSGGREMLERYRIFSFFFFRWSYSIWQCKFPIRSHTTKTSASERKNTGARSKIAIRYFRFSSHFTNKFNDLHILIYLQQKNHICWKLLSSACQRILFVLRARCTFRIKSDINYLPHSL